MRAWWRPVPKSSTGLTWMRMQPVLFATPQALLATPRAYCTPHRSTMLHAYASLMPDALGLSHRDVVLPIVPMFHVNAWGLPYGCPMVGAKLVFPGSKMGGRGPPWRN